VPQYFVEDSHPAIIDPAQFALVQNIFAERSGDPKHSGATIFSGKIRCGCCGGWYGSKVWHSNDKYRRVVWQCNAKFKREHKCTTPHLTEEAIREKFIEAFNHLIPDRERLIEDCRDMQRVLTDYTEVDAEIAAVQDETEVIEALMHRCVEENSQTALNQDAYNERYSSLVERYEKAKAKQKTLRKKRSDRVQKAEAIGGFMFALMEREQPLETFTDGLWIDSMDQVVVQSDGTMVFRFRNGSEITV
jgi:regulator of replication initiation timing